MRVTVNFHFQSIFLQTSNNLNNTLLALNEHLMTN